MSYIDLMAAPVPAEKKIAYADFAKRVGQIFKDHGAIAVLDAWEDDVPLGELTSFPRAVQREDGEAVAVGWMVWPDKATRDKAFEAAMKDERMSEMDALFDGKRLIYGGFNTISEL